MKKIIILGSTGSIGTSTLKSISKEKNFKVFLLTANKNINKLLNQSIKYNVKHAIIEDNRKYIKYKKLFKKYKINLHCGFKNINNFLKNKVSFSINAISGINGLDPTLKIIPFTKKILIANKETIICAWDIISKELIKHKTEFIPIDSEHFSIWKLINNENIKNLDQIFLTASGGPLLNKTKKQLLKVEPKIALNHPNWKMGKKISIDSSTMMNKIFEFIEAKKIFNLKKNKLSIIIQPSSFVHAIVFFKGNIIKLLAHKCNMMIPISNALGIHNKINKDTFLENINELNNLKFQKPSIKQFPLLKILNFVPENSSYFETILITINDNLVYKYLDNDINYISINRNLIRFIKSPFLRKYYKLKPKSIYDIKKMINLTNNFIENKIKNYAK